MMGLHYKFIIDLRFSANSDLKNLVLKFELLRLKSWVVENVLWNYVLVRSKDSLTYDIQHAQWTSAVWQ